MATVSWYLARTWPDLEYPLLMMAFLGFLIVGTVWLYLRPAIDLASLRGRPLLVVGFGMLVVAGLLFILAVPADMT